MPIIPISNSFVDQFGNNTTYLKSNAGDYIRSSFTFQENIRVQSGVSATITNNNTTDILEWLGGSWEDEGFRVGDTVVCTVYTTSNGVILGTPLTTTIEWINGSQMKLVSMSFSEWYQYPDSAVDIVNTRNRQGFELYFNMVSNGSTGSEYSLIDGEVTRFQVDVTNPAVPVVTQVGNKSGAYLLSVALVLVSQTGYTREYNLRINFVQSGLYNSNLFNFNNCLKVYIGMYWQSLVGEPYSQLVEIISDDANTGWFNQAHNGDITDATLVQSVTEIAYDQPTLGTFVIDSASSNYMIGSAYISGQNSYYKIQPQNQSELTMLIPSSIPVSGVPNQSSLNPDGAGYDILLTSITSVGTVHTIDFTLTPNSNFTTFMDGQSEGNRTFYMWMKYGNVNVLVFSGQLTKQPAVVGTIPLVSSEYFDHAQQLTDTTLSTVASGYTGNVEDDFGWVGKWRWPKKALVTYVRVGVQAYNSSTGESFTLQQSSFNLTGVPIENSGLEGYILDEVQAVNTSLPTTSVKRQVQLERDSSIDQAVYYGVRLYYPYLYRWESWLPLMNANSDFYPNEQTRNWVPYGNTGSWNLRLNVEYDLNGSAYEYFDDILINNYDSDANILQEVSLFRESPLQNVQVIIDGEIMRVVVTHTLVNGASWLNYGTWGLWGMITIEPTESSPRWICSTAVPFDNNTLNPLTPLAGLYCDLSFPSPSVARLECRLDSNKINLQNGVKITSKIKGCAY
tara:strand:- start:3047 stop:5248 length:2202 start_codon:yes stop_codon:yes gene_type:complete